MFKSLLKKKKKNNFSVTATLYQKLKKQADTKPLIACQFRILLHLEHRTWTDYLPVRGSHLRKLEKTLVQIFFCCLQEDAHTEHIELAKSFKE